MRIASSSTTRCSLLDSAVANRLMMVLRIVYSTGRRTKKTTRPAVLPSLMNVVRPTAVKIRPNAPAGTKVRMAMFDRFAELVIVVVPSLDERVT